MTAVAQRSAGPIHLVDDDLQPFTRSDQESVACEAALEAINELIGAYSARIAAEEAKPRPTKRRSLNGSRSGDAAAPSAAVAGQRPRRDRTDPR